MLLTSLSEGLSTINMENSFMFMIGTACFLGLVLSVVLVTNGVDGIIKNIKDIRKIKIKDDNK